MGTLERRNVTRNEFHCTGCASVDECDMAFEPRSGTCTRYARSAAFPCKECLRSGQAACQRTGLVKCSFIPRSCATCGAKESEE